MIDSGADYGVHCVLINKEPWDNPRPKVANTLIGPVVFAGGDGLPLSPPSHRTWC